MKNVVDRQGLGLPWPLHVLSVYQKNALKRMHSIKMHSGNALRNALRKCTHDLPDLAHAQEFARCLPYQADYVAADPTVQTCGENVRWANGSPVFSPLASRIC